MSEHAWFLVNVWVTAGLLAICAPFLGWGLWSLFWSLYDSHMERVTRIRNTELDSAWRNQQFSVGRDQKDRWI